MLKTTLHDNPGFLWNARHISHIWILYRYLAVFIHVLFKHVYTEVYVHKVYTGIPNPLSVCYLSILCDVIMTVIQFVNTCMI